MEGKVKRLHGGGGWALEGMLGTTKAFLNFHSISQPQDRKPTSRELQSVLENWEIPEVWQENEEVV